MLLHAVACRKYLPSMDDSGITCDEIIEEIVPTNFNEKK